MFRSKLGLFGLFVLLLSLVAASAQAAQWLIVNAKEEVKTGTELSAILGSELDSTLVLLTSILGIHTEILCSGAELIAIEFIGEGKLKEGGKVRLTGCDVKLNGTLNSECEVRSPGKSNGTVETNELKGQLKLIEGSGFIVIEPKTGTILMTLEMGAGCPLGNKDTINGTIDIEDCEGFEETHLVKHLLQPNKLTSLKVNGNNATLKGSVWVKLTGADAGLAFSADKE